MGNCPGSQKGGEKFRSNDIEESQTPDEINEGLVDDWTQENLTSHLDELMKAMQLHNLNRMKHEVQTDINTFILNNLLMSIQFFDNFERSKDAANKFKLQKESQITEKLAPNPTDGMILGERRCHLLHGMGQVLSNNYIYRSPDNAGEEEYYGFYYYGSDPKNTFMSEAILPLEFIMTWDNLEVYPDNEFEMLQAMTYSSAKGSPPILRFCMEEPDSKNNVPRGYLRLRSVDVTADIYKAPTSTESSYDYTYAERFSDKAESVGSDSEEGALSEYSGSDVDVEELRNKILTSRTFLHTATSTPSSSQPSLERPKPPLPVDKPKKPTLSSEIAMKSLREKLENRRPSGVLPINYPMLGKSVTKSPKPSLTINESMVPSLRVNEASTPPVSNNQPPSFIYTPNSTNSLYPPSVRQRLKGLSRPAQIIALAGNSSSSGYETMDSAAMSRSSSVASEEIRYKWRQVELKQLAQYPARKRGRADIEAEKQDPLSPKCFIPIQRELSSDEESESDSECSSDTDTEKAKKETQYDTRYYLNSTQFSSEFCSEFHHIGIKSGISPSALSQAVVLGTTIRCAVENIQVEDKLEEECFYITQTFTPAVHSKSWPANYYFWFNQRMINRKNASDLDDHWPSQEQVEKIEKLGSNAVPLGFRTLQFFNTQQSLEWQVNFIQAETLLMDSFKNVHWRTYIFASLIFRAFIAPLGPQGVGVEHIRNIIYFMCNEDFVGWNDEQPGVHLRAALSKLFDCLGKGKMPNFFIRNQDLLKSIPTQNSRLVQAHLSKIRDNLIVYCIYAFRNLTCIRPKGNFYPMPDFKQLYNIITVPQEKLLQINNPALASRGMNSPDENIKPKNHRGKNKPGKLNLIDQADQIEESFRDYVVPNQSAKKDKNYRRMVKKRLAYEEQLRAIEREQKNKRLSPDDRIPMAERRKSIDLKQLPVIQAKFSSLRKVLVIEFFINHFIEMAKKSNEFRAYGQSTMYIMQVENLCEILLDSSINLGETSLDRESVEEYQRKCGLLRELVGKDIREYVLSRFSHLNIPTLTNQTYNVFGEWSKNRTFHNNWDFRKLPTPPGSHVDPAEFEKSQQLRKLTPMNKRLETPDIAKSLQSIKPLSPIPSEASSTKLARRAESIKFIDKPVTMKKSASRQSIIFVDEFESTDL